MTAYDRIAMVTILSGYHLNLLTMTTSGTYYVSSEGAVEAMFIIAFLCYTIAAILVLILNLTEHHRGDIKMVLSTTAFTFLAFVFLLVGLSVFGSNLTSAGSVRPAAYPTSTYTVSMLLALLGGLFLSLYVNGRKEESAPVHRNSVTHVMEADK